MTDTQSRIALAGQLVESYAEGWQRDHREAMECYEFEAALAFGVATFRITEVMRDLVEQFITHGGDPAHRGGMHSLYEQWLAAANTDLTDLDEFEKRFGHVANALELRECIRKAQDALAAWPTIPPAPKAVGSRVIPLSEDEATALHAIQNAPPDSPGKLKIKPQAIPLVDDSLLK